jgi:hypothetical protein
VTRTPVAVAAVVLGLAAPALAATPSVFDDYAPDGALDPCEHTTAQLQKALDTVPPDVEQYAADYPAAIEDALEARARGDCGGGPATSGGGGGTPAPAETPAAAATPAPAADPATTGGEIVPVPPAPGSGTTPAGAGGVAAAELEPAASGTPGGSAPLPVVLLGALALAAALAVLTGVAMRRLGLADDRLAPAAHAWREAAWRAGGTWADFRDWLRLGR